MNESLNNKNSFTSYEYKDINIRRGMERLYADGYPSFGWTLDATEPSLSLTNICFKFKRNRRIQNKAELTRLQQEFEGKAHEIEKLEESKAIAPSVIAYGLGIVGAAFTAGSILAFLSHSTVLCIILAIPALIGWIVPYFAFNKVKQNKEEKMAPIIDRQYDAIYEVCEQANRLLAS